MLKLQRFTEVLEEFDGRDHERITRDITLHPNVEDAADKIRDLAHEMVEVHQARETAGRPIGETLLTLAIGDVRKDNRFRSKSMPHRFRKGLAIDPVTMLALVHRGLRLMHHPSLSVINFDAEDEPQAVVVGDVSGRVFEIVARDVTDKKQPKPKRKR